MKSIEILNLLCADMPPSLAMDWDNVGLILGRREKEVNKVMLALDLSSELLKEAIEKKVDLIITHHPLIFSPLKKITDEEVIGNKIIEILREDMAYIAMHTNYDVAESCMADIAAERIGLKGGPLEPTFSFEEEGRMKELGIGKVGELEGEYSIEELAKKVKTAFGLDFVRIFGAGLTKGRIKRAAISPGSGKGMYKWAKKAGAQVLITGDITHHEALDALEEGISIIDAGHYGLEHIFIEDMKKRIGKLNPSIEIYTEEVNFPDMIL
ncbi:MAG: Nif3-like dinuclear metal center hexameric protein [Johnsonella sp.]|nr:Nif3-like dinuclear metal center hexameric protein [Johnsonella sp.]